MKSNLLRQMYCSSQDGLLCRKRLSTGIGGNGKCSLLDQDIETACSVTSAEKNRDLICSTAAALGIAECFSLAPQIFLLFLKFSLQWLPDAPEHPCGTPGCSRRVCRARMLLGKASHACLCCCRGLSAPPCQQRAQHKLL